MVFPILNGNAQVGIGNTSPSSDALLDVGTNTSTAGLRLPRVALTATNNASPLSAHVQGMTVYNTATNGTGSTAITPGFYYNDGSGWIRLANNDDWKLLGNAGTNSATNFIGTTDAQDLVLKSNNVEGTRITSAETVVNENGSAYNFRVESNNLTHLIFADATNDVVGIGTSTPSTSGGVAIDRLAVEGTGTTTGTNFTPVGQFYNTGDGAALGVINNSATNSNNALETGTNGTGYAIRALHLPTSGSGVGVYGLSNSSDANGVIGSIPTTGSWLGFGGLFLGGLGYFDGLYNLSDARAKKDISVIDSKIALEKILSIKGYTYRYDTQKFNKNSSPDNKTYYGFMAQNVKKHLPYAVVKKRVPFRNKHIDINSVNENNYSEKKLNVVDYTALIPVLVEAIKEQQKLIVKLEKKINL